MTSNYVRVSGLADLFTEARELSARTMIFDVEPLVAPWHGSQESLDQGIARILGDVRTVPSVRVVVFATNSARRPSAVPACDGLQVRYLASAEKPLRTAPYRDLPRPGAVAGDQLPTDGILAYRLGFTFLHYAPELAGVPLGPGLMHRWGELVRPVLFRRSAGPGGESAAGHCRVALSDHEPSGTAQQTVVWLLPDAPFAVTTPGAAIEHRGLAVPRTGTPNAAVKVCDQITTRPATRSPRT